VPQVAAETTGRYLVLIDEKALETAVTRLESAGISFAAASGKRAKKAPEDVVFEQLGVAVVTAEPDQLSQAGVFAAASGIVTVEPERVVYAIGDIPLHSADYLRGYRDAVLHLTGGVVGAAAVGAIAPAAVDETQATWGLQATNTLASCCSGVGIRLAVLDTGVDATHPDLAGRTLVAQSFVSGEEAQDRHGHGTHCIGTAAGPKCPGTKPRYGIAYDAEIYAGKVLSNAGSGSDSQILAGIDWALTNGCQVVSMSLGARTQPGQAYSQVFERVARRAAAAGTLIVAAAGNDSDRAQGRVAPVAHPANCPSIMAIAALDVEGRVANFSNGGLNPDGGQIDVAGPGVAVRSMWPMPTAYRTISGTSMATPHAAGIAALLAEANPDARGSALGRLLTGTARRLELPSTDVGAGMVQAP
jgi:subtilisin family serine protease